MGKQSDALFQRAQDVIPGGVNSPVRAFGGVGGTPPFIELAQGSRIFDADNLQYIDCVGSWGPMILGHGHRYVVEAVKKAATRGFSYGAPTAAEIELAEMIVQAVPSMEMVRLVNSGTEATMSALRLARAATGRNKILKFEGGYHGHVDSLLVKAGSGGATFNVPDSAGVPKELAELTLIARYNDLDDVRAQMSDEVAAIIVEPIAGNMGCIPPNPGFLQGLREICDDHASLLILDEVMTGFRVAYGGAQARYDVRPDITTLGKIIGGGMPIGAYGASKLLMEYVSPLGPMYQAGTLSGNPVAVAAGRATLSVLRNSSIYDDLEERSAEFENGVRAASEKHAVPLTFNRVGSMWTIFFTEGPVTDFASANKSNREKFSRFFHLMLGEGVYLPPSQLEAAFFSAAHAKKDILQLVERVDRVLKKVAWEFGT
ncbi:MAG: glutamate-1-semialdehyde 2,1-aminomutase [Acidobacteria bacterium]|nr:glutamate-1-semialdehyde 2,1-aminomutase [Acidobacteriota bacterium]MBV9476663.1 glutamate-1-semialdehyde 2,1-aminomutase [Acidobacteriota bacterium]